MTNEQQCSIDGCIKKINTFKSGYCIMHEKRWRRHGDPLGGGTFRHPAKPQCIVDGCESKVKSAGYCSKHVHRVNKYGTTEPDFTARGDLKRFALGAATLNTDECIIWPYLGSVAHGYGQLFLNGRTVKAHRFVCEIAHGKCPSDKRHAAHSCGVRLCVNPKHLRWATPKENAKDKESHGTVLRGEDAPWSKLSQSDVLEIRNLSGSIPNKKIAEIYNVSISAIASIISGRNWAHI